MTMQGTGATPATVALSKLGVAFAIRTYAHHPGETDFGGEAARELAVPPERILKTLLVDVDGVLTVGIVPVTGRLDLKGIAAARGGKRARLADPAVAEQKTGYVVGGISPLGQRSALPTVLDSSALAHPSVLVSGGRRGFDIELDPADLARVTGAQVAAIGRA